MKNQHLLLPAAVLSCACGLAQAQSSFEPLGLVDQTPTDMTPDGQIIVGTSLFGTGVWMYDDTNGFVDLNGAGDQPSVSDDGTVVHAGVLDAMGNNNAAMWDAVNGWQIIGPYPGVTSGCPALSNAYDISGDGQVMVGLGWNGCVATAYRWEASTGMVDLGLPGPGTQSRANGVDQDGSVVVGWGTATFGNRTPAIWINGISQLLGSLDPTDPATGPGEAYVVTPDGSTVYGESNGSLFRWTSTNGLEDLGNLPGSAAADAALPLAISADGSTVVGTNGNPFFGTPFRAFYYTDQLGMVDLAQYLTATGATIPPGWTLDQLTGVSADGSIVTGFGFNGNTGRFEAFRANVDVIPPPCGGTQVATATLRLDSAGVNLQGFRADPPVMGKLWTADVRNNLTGHNMAGVVGYAAPLDLQIGIGSVLVDVTDPAGELLGLLPQAGSFTVSFSATIPLDPGICGFPFSTQGVSFGGPGISLHNAYDLVVGDV